METPTPALLPGFALYQRTHPGRALGPTGIRVFANRPAINLLGAMYKDLCGQRVVLAIDEGAQKMAICRADEGEPGPRVSSNSLSCAWAKHTAAPGFYPAELIDGWWVVDLAPGAQA